MQSEKEIKAKIDWLKKLDDKDVAIDLDMETLKLTKDFDKGITFNDYEVGNLEDIIKAIEWTLKGEPRYSAAEIEKVMIATMLGRTSDNSSIIKISDLFKDSKKVELILNGKP